MKADRRTWTDIMKLIVGFHNFAKKPKKGVIMLRTKDALHFSQIVVHEVINSLSFSILPHNCTWCHLKQAKKVTDSSK